MNRRDFLRRSALVAAGVVAADQLDVLDRLGWKRRFFPGWSRAAFAGTEDTTWLASHPLQQEPIIVVVDQYGQEIARSGAVGGVAEFSTVMIAAPWMYSPSLTFRVHRSGGKVQSF